MNSSSESYDEEGEVFETEVEKAPPSLPSVAGSRVDRLSSRNRGSRSPAPGSHPSNDDAYAASVRRDRLDREYDRRLGNEDFLRAEKRRRSYERGPDPRQHRIHYEANGDLRRPTVSYADIDRSVPPDIPHAFDPDDRYYRESKRSRIHSRSPPRGPRGEIRVGRRRYFDDGRRDCGNRYTDKERENDRGRNNNRRHSREQSVSEQGDLPAPSELSKRDAEHHNGKSDQGPQEKQSFFARGYNSSNGRSAKPLGGVKFCPEAEIYGSNRNLPVEKALLKPASDDVEVEEPIDEAKLIEERRKKRQAIKAKYRGQATPLLASALAIASSNPDSPGRSEGENTPGRSYSLLVYSLETYSCLAVDSPALPDSSREDSPADAFNISKDGSAVIKGPTEASIVDDGPSAADYDPTMDMQEDNKRNEQRMYEHEVPSGACDETKTTSRDEQPSKTFQGQDQHQPAKKADDDDFDMFAEGDDDMFAEPAPKAKKEKPGADKAHTAVSDAKQLDASLLDNWDDPEGYYRVIPAELLDGRYRIQTNLGRGMFSGVVRALDLTAKKQVAIKIIRSNETM